MSRVYLGLPVVAALAVIVVLAVTLGGNRPSATPTHVTAVFFDGVDHGDYRQTCSVWEAARSKMAKCEAGLTVQLASAARMGEWGGYKVVARSEKMWRTGAIEYATVQVVYVPSGGQTLTAHLRKRPGGPWLVWFVV